MHRRRRLAGLIAVAVAAVALAACDAAPPSSAGVGCGDAGSAGATVAACHLTVHPYAIDGNPFAQQIADTLAASVATCSNLAQSHTAGPALLAAYPGAQAVGENLYCLTYGPNSCPSNGDGATNAINAWLASPGHRANIDGFAGASVVGGAACNFATGYYFAVAQFHRP